MSFEYSPYILPLIAAAFISAVIAIYAWLHRSATGALPLALMALALVVWSLGDALQLSGADFSTQLFWAKNRYFGIAAVPLLWLIFVLEYTGKGKVLTRRNLILSAILPLITLALTLTAERHGLIWRDIRLDSSGPFSVLLVSFGVWFWVHTTYSYLALLLGAIFLIRQLLHVQGLYRGQSIALLIAVSAPWLGNVLYLTGSSPILHLDLTPFAFTVTVAALAWAVFGFRLVDITPLARDLVMDAMREGMIVLDVRGNVVDINSAAARMIGVPVANAIGKKAEDVFHPWSHLVERFRNMMEAKDEISVGEGEARRRYEVRLSPLQDQQGQLVGRVIMLRAVDEAEAPQPRFARSAAAQSDTRPYYQAGMEESDHSLPKKPPPFLRALADFYYPPVKNDLAEPGNFNPVWYRTRERMFTLVARLTASFVALGILFFVFSEFRSVIGSVILAAIVALFLFVGWLRNANYYFRVVVFLSLVYVLGVAAVLNFGFTAPGFVFFMVYVIVSAALTSPRGAFYALVTGTLTVGIFAVLLGSGTFTPLRTAVIGGVFPFSMLSGLGTVFLFASSAFILLTSVVLLLDNLDRAWQKETQTLNLLQQERDLLEQRVGERTRALSEARDEAEKISNDLRKYFRAIEQSGSAVVITDVNGNIEYANPRFEQSTGYSAAEALGQNPRILKSGVQPREYYQGMWETILAGRVWNGELLNKRKDGSLYWEHATIAPVLDQNGVITNFAAVKEDITKRKIDEENLLRLSQAVEQSGNTMLIMDQNGLIEYVNPKFSEVTGYLPAEALGKAPAVLMNGMDETFDFRSQDWWQTVSAGQVWRGEFCNRRKDGSIFWESATIAPVFNRSGEIINFVEIKQDITEQKILQEQIQKQNDYLSLLHQVTLDLLNRRDLDSLLQVIVERSATLLDAPFSELFIERGGALVVEAFTANHSDVKGERLSREQAQLPWKAFDMRQPVILNEYAKWQRRRKTPTADILHAAADFPIMAGERCLGVLSLGRSQPGYAFTPEQIESGILFARLTALVLDNASLYDEAVKEIAERKRAEALLQESEARFRQIVENASDIIYRTDAEGRFTYINPSAMVAMGYTRERQVLGRHYLELAMPEYRAELKRFYERQYRNRTLSSYYEFPAITMSGAIIWIGQSVQLIMDDEKVTGFQAVARDITQLRQAQEALALSRDQALDASRFKSQLLSRVSHELRTPLGGILGYAELLQYEAFGSLTGEQKKAVDNIIESAQYLTDIVNDLLDEHQIESKSVSLYNEYFRTADLLEKTRSTASVLAEKKGLTFTAEMDDDLPDEIYGDMNRLQQILINLTGNAVKFTKEGGVSVKFSRPAPAQWRIEVRDTGAGIPFEDQANIFEPFRQVSNSITRQNRGSGLGLAITKQLVELMGGQITLKSQPGMGSLFTAILPIKNAPGE